MTVAAQRRAKPISLPGSGRHRKALPPTKTSTVWMRATPAMIRMNALFAASREKRFMLSVRALKLLNIPAKTKKQKNPHINAAWEEYRAATTGLIRKKSEVTTVHSPAVIICDIIERQRTPSPAGTNAADECTSVSVRREAAGPPAEDIPSEST